MKKKKKHPKVSKRIRLYVYFFFRICGFLVIWNHKKNLTRKVFLGYPLFGLESRINFDVDKRMKVAIRPMKY